MTTKEFLYVNQIDEDQLAKLLGFKTSQSIKKRMDEEMPERWVRKLDNISGTVDSSETASDEPTNESEREPKLTDEEINQWISSEGRDNDGDPNILNTGMPEVIGPQKIKIATIRGYIEMVYGGAESLARARGDVIAAETIHQYTPQYVEAWVDYIKFDSRILKYLEALQIGTPIGNLIGVHAISVGAYVLARITAQEIAAHATRNGDEPEGEFIPPN